MVGITSAFYSSSANFTNKIFFLADEIFFVFGETHFKDYTRFRGRRLPRGELEEKLKGDLKEELRVS